MTTATKEKTSQALEHPFARPFLPMVPTSVRNLLRGSSEVDDLMVEYDSAEHYISTFADDIGARLNRNNKNLEVIVRDSTCDYANLIGTRGSYYTGSILTKKTWDSWIDGNGKLSVSGAHVRASIFCWV